MLGSINICWIKKKKNIPRTKDYKPRKGTIQRHIVEALHAAEALHILIGRNEKDREPDFSLIC